MSARLWVVLSHPSEGARRWALIAAFGALWGAVEITFGSFLHALRLPFTGTALAALSAALLVSQRQLISRPGMSLSTGIVAAICKSVSPGGVILGPMLGITVEALLVEVALIVAPRSRAGAALAGALAVCWATFQKVLTHYVYYGWSILELYVALVSEGAELVGLSPEGGFQLLGGLVVAIAASGALAAMLGRSVGRSVAEELRRDPSRHEGGDA